MSTKKMINIVVFTVVLITVVGILFSKFVAHAAIFIVCVLGAMYTIEQKNALNKRNPAIDINYNILNYPDEVH
jgi:hypothetical protein